MAWTRFGNDVPALTNELSATRRLTSWRVVEQILGLLSMNQSRKTICAATPDFRPFAAKPSPLGKTL
jgi:hypothetical protein